MLFPAFEQATGMNGMGPTAVMRMEHEQMRGVLSQMEQEASRGDYDALSDHGDTLQMLIQQHNVKEEGMLYPMCERTLTPRWAEIAGRLEQF